MGIDGIPDFEELRIAESYPLDDALPYVFGKEVRHLVRLDIAADLEFTGRPEDRSPQEHQHQCGCAQITPEMSFVGGHGTLLTGAAQSLHRAGASHCKALTSYENRPRIEIISRYVDNFCLMLHIFI